MSRPSSRSWCSVSAVPIDATTGSTAACLSAITSVLPSTTIARSCFAIAGLARWRPYRTLPFLKSSLSGVFTYLPRSGSSSRSRRAWKPITRPSRVGEREHQPEREVVVAAPVREPGRLDLVDLEAPLPRLGDQPRSLREPEPELLRDLLAELARARGTRARARPPSDSQRTRSKYVVACSSSEVSRSRRRRAASCLGDVSSYSSVTRKRSASHSIDSAKSRFSVSWTKRTTSPPFPQPKQ